MNEISVLLLHGAGGSGPWHWQQWLASRLPVHGALVEFPALPDADTPTLDAWLPALRSSLATVPASAELVVAAYSCGAALWLHHAATIDGRARRADRVLLVAPPDPEWPEPEYGDLVPYPRQPRSLRRAAGVTRLVVGTGDPHIGMHSAHSLAEQLQIELDVLSDGEHIDTVAGYGPWASALRWSLYGSVPLLDRFDGEPHTAGCSPERLRLV